MLCGLGAITDPFTQARDRIVRESGRKAKVTRQPARREPPPPPAEPVQVEVGTIVPPWYKRPRVVIPTVLALAGGVYYVARKKRGR